MKRHKCCSKDTTYGRSRFWELRKAAFTQQTKVNLLLFGDFKLVCVNGIGTFCKQFSIWRQQLAHVIPLVFVPLTGTNLGLPTWVCHFKFGVLITRHRWVISLLISCHSRVLISVLNGHRRVSGGIILYRLVVSGLVIKFRKQSWESTLADWLKIVFV